MVNLLLFEDFRLQSRGYIGLFVTVLIVFPSKPEGDTGWSLGDWFVVAIVTSLKEGFIQSEFQVRCVVVTDGVLMC